MRVDFLNFARGDLFGNVRVVFHSAYSKKESFWSETDWAGAISGGAVAIFNDARIFLEAFGAVTNAIVCILDLHRGHSKTSLPNTRASN